MEYLGLDINDELLEDLFYKFDYNLSGVIDYYEFREIYLLICNVRAELEDRGIDTPSLIRKSTLRDILRQVLDEEENRERRAIAEAKRFKKWILNSRDSKRLLQKAEFRAYNELRNALDAGGHVYVIGCGNYGQFNQPGFDKYETKKFKFEFYQKVLQLWRDRIEPEQLVDRLRAQRKAEEQEEARDADRVLTGISAILKDLKKRKKVTDPFEEAQQSPFIGLTVSINTVSLWCRRIYQVAASENVLFALADTGEIYTWGGNAFWWHEIQADSIYQTKWRGDTTARSQLLMRTKNKILPPDVTIETDFNKLSPEDKKAEIIKVVAKYYNVWEPPPNPAERMIYLEKEILTKIEYDTVIFSLKCRGKVIGEMNKLQLVETLYEDILLEKKLLGERAHRAIKEIETQIAGLLRRKKNKLASQFEKRIEEMWAPLREVQAESKAAAIAKKQQEVNQEQLQKQENYQEWRIRVAKKREDADIEDQGKRTPRGNSLDINLIGVTPRGPEVATPRGYQAALQISAGTAHAGLVHKTGHLYMWGIGASGRLGFDLTEGGDPQADVAQPTLVQAFAEKTVIRVSCGYSHTGCITAGGDLYMWGSAVTGKLGLGTVVKGEECYASIPTRVIVSAEDRRIKKLSCGAAHTAVITEGGQLYVFGCGDGGRLGTGKGRYESFYVPTLVQSLTHERVATVSCGNSTTLVATEISHLWSGDMEDKYRKLTGGRLYVAGSSNVLGRQFDEFTHLPVRGGLNQQSQEALNNSTSEEDSNYEVCIKQVSAGFTHSVIVSAEGEVFCWGHNKTGCCGVPLVQQFVDRPTPLRFLYTRPVNLAIGKKAYQSTTYNSRDAKYAVNGRKDGNGVNRSACTQQESQPWIEIDLGAMAMIDKILVWNRTDLPADKNLPDDYYSSRLFPCWIMVGRESFPKEANIVSLKDSLRTAVSKAKFTENKRISTWRCPANTQGRFIRLQLEKYNTLSVAEIEIFGYWGFSHGVGRCSYAIAGRDVTVTLVRPSNDPRDVEFLYKRSVYADAENADILRQYETYVLEYDKYGRGEVLTTDNCLICKGIEKCESCLVYEIFSREISSMPPSIGGKRQRLNEITDYLINQNKPDLEPINIRRSKRPTKWNLRKDALFGNFSLLKYLFPKTKSLPTHEQAITTNPNELGKTLQYVNKLEEESLASELKENRKEKEKDDKLKKIMEHIRVRSSTPAEGGGPGGRSSRGDGGGGGGASDDYDNQSLGMESFESSVGSSQVVLQNGLNDNPALIPVYSSMSVTAEGSIAEGSILPNESVGTVERRLARSGLKNSQSLPSIASTGKIPAGTRSTALQLKSGSTFGLPPLPLKDSETKVHGFGPNLKQQVNVGDILPTGHIVKPPTPLSMVEQLNQKHNIETASDTSQSKGSRRGRRKNRQRGGGSS